MGDRMVTVTISGLEGWEKIQLSHYRIDARHSNAHTVWEELGRPDWPTDEQIAAMRLHEGLEKYEPDREVTPAGGRVSIKTPLPTHSVSLLLLTRGTD